MTIPTPFQPYFTKSNLQTPTPIQAQSWPLALAGHDILAQAPTGSGKTLAFLLPSVPHIHNALSYTTTKTTGTPASPIALVICPTRELAKQVRSVAKSFRRLYGIHSAAVHGGSIDKQIEKCRGDKPLHLLVSTPGRLYDLTKRGDVVLSNVTYLVLDEADRLIVNDYEEHLTYVRNALAPQRQTVMFSATMPRNLEEKLEATWRGEGSASLSALPTQRVMLCARKEVASSDDEADLGERANAGSSSSSSSSSTTSTSTTSAFMATQFDPATLRSLVQTVHVCAEHKKSKKLIKFLQKIRLPEKKDATRLPALVIVFCNRIKTVLYVKDLVCKMYPKCAALHGKMNQETRDQVLVNFRAAKTHVLVATDIAARGLDIKHLPIVVNWDMPSTMESYVHRVGRAARHSGDRGIAYTFYTRHFHRMARDMINMLNSTSQQVDPNLVDLAIKSEQNDQELLKESEGVDNNGEEEIESDAEPTDMPLSFGKNKNLALLSTTTYDDWSDSSDDEEEGGEEVAVDVDVGVGVGVAVPVPVEVVEVPVAVEETPVDHTKGRTEKIQESANARPDSVPSGGKGSYRELCKQDFKRAAWLAGKASAKRTQEINGKEQDQHRDQQQPHEGGGGAKKKKKKGGLKRPRGRRGGKKNRKGGGGGPPHANKKQRFNNKKERQQQQQKSFPKKE